MSPFAEVVCPTCFEVFAVPAPGLVRGSVRTRLRLRGVLRADANLLQCG